jgi:hypothetical protein
MTTKLVLLYMRDTRTKAAKKKTTWGNTVMRAHMNSTPVCAQMRHTFSGRVEQVYPLACHHILPGIAPQNQTRGLSSGHVPR